MPSTPVDIEQDTEVISRAGVPANYSLVWSDEFSVNGQPSTTNWNYHVGNGYNPGLPGFQGWGNGEWEWYRPNNCYVSGGNLVIKGEYSTTPYYRVGGRDWYQKSGRITTQGKKSWKYGYIEARIKLPKGQGNWSAFWMMGTSGTSSSGEMYTSSYNPADSYYSTMLNNWASCGEIDIMEHAGASTNGIANCFWDTRTGVYPWTSGYNASSPNEAVPYGDVSQYHLYALKWDANSMIWYVDGVQTHTVDITPATLEEFRKPFYLILNLAIGGTLGGDVDAGAFPMYMYVDYVRVYQPSSGSTTSRQINCGGSAASPYVADTGFSGGTPASFTATVNTSLCSTPVPPQAVLKTERYGNITYTITGFTAGSSHNVKLFFVENYWSAIGRRKFDVEINGSKKLSNFDVYATTGAKNKASQQNFLVNANASGQYVIKLTTVTDNALINGIWIE
jgi:beta-glucanase (GH16 family)